MSNGKILGLDLGITSVGFGIIDEKDNSIVDYGVRLFDESSADNNLSRRTFRGQRRLKARKHNRIMAIKYYLFNHGMIDSVDFTILKNVYELRVKGLHSKLTNVELANVLVNIAKRRGSSLEVAVDETTDDAKLASALTANTQELIKSQLYICELLNNKIQSGAKIRNTENVFRTSDYEKELRQILSNQCLSDSQIEDIVEIVIRRRSFSEGPGSEKFPTRYGSYREEIVDGKPIIKHVNLIDEMRGKCSVYPDELRAPKNSFSAYKFNLLNDLNNLSFNNDEKVTTEQKNDVIEYIKEKGSITVKQLLKLLNIDSIDSVKGFRLDAKGKPIITTFDVYNKMLKDCVNLEIIQNEDVFDSIIEILTNTQVIEQRQKALEELDTNLSSEEIKKISSYAKVNGYHSLSLKAIKQLNDEMMNSNDNQMQILTRLVIRNDSNVKSNNVSFDDSLILSPVAKRVHRQAIRVINELRHTYGEFSKVVIETTRSKNSLEERKEIQEIAKKNKEQKEKTDRIFLDLEKNPDNYNTPTKLKLRLYMEQDGKTIYGGLPIDIDTLLNDSSAYQIEHIIPYSISFDNSLNNKALASHKENQDKGNNTPFYYIQRGGLSSLPNASIRSWDEFKAIVEAMYENKKISGKKKEYLLSQEDYSKFSNMEKFVARNLVDTSYGIKSAMSTLKRFYKTNEIDTKVFTIKGKITHDFRQRVGLNKNRDEFIHHAIDALIIAAVNNEKTFKDIYKLEEHIGDYSNVNELVLKDTGEVVTVDNNPLENQNLLRFVKSLKDIKPKPFDFSYKVDKKTNRSFADQTIYSTRNYDNIDYVIKKYKDIYSSDGENLKKLFDEGNAKDKLLVAKNDPQTFEILEKIYEQYKNEKNPFLSYKNEYGYIKKYSKKGNGPEIISLKYIDSKLGNHLDISQNYNLEKSTKKVVLLQNSPYRTDVYISKDGFYQFVTIRRYHIKQIDGFNVINEELYQSLLDKKNMKNSSFLFSLNRNDIINLVYNDEIIQNVDNVSKFYRFIATNNDLKNMIEVKLIESKTEKQMMKVIGKKVVKFEKYTVSPTGKYSKVLNEDLKLKW